MKTVIALFGLTGLLAFGTPAYATQPGVVARPDLNGDGRADLVAAEVDGSNPNEQVLTATVRGRTYSARLPVDPYYGVQPLRVTDVNNDGREEVAAIEVIGASTEFSSLWGLTGGRLRAVRKTDGTRLYLIEGGSVREINRYGCESVGKRRQLVVVNAQLTNETTMVYSGERIRYSVRNGVAVETARTPAAGTSDAAVFQVDPAACG
ncbi:hypothetical protein JOF56_010430 [Kibdelosporangium banguiense]|uniref:VCBS repeat-containing protein n=1 Tax=Kibdelosporangium banguiense TaxID=1365924 RepID=A0ABS4U066_9PSEU|nr:VCBS repeat-containing protein [Kibdelosporangium banguiense]MBP2330045.1 hypothetical protein [Kibdelosporangium banguiense]